jgi:RNA polymerase sigma factor (sigma-70 family)
MSQLLRFIRAATHAGTDRDLLDRFTRSRDEEAFSMIVRRYGPGVWAACRRLVGWNADDAFQAVFLTLARKAGSVSGSLPAWLHAVARRVAANLRRASQRRSAAETTAARPDENQPDDVTLREGLALLDEELARLPERYRTVLIVCCLEGRSRAEAALQLGWTEGQVKGRLERAREMLRKRLGRRGIELGGVLLAATLPTSAPAAPVLPSASLLTAGQAVSPLALSLTHGVVHAMLLQKLTIVATVLLAAAVAGVLASRAALSGTEAAGEVLTPAKPTMTAPVPLNRSEKPIQDKEGTAKFEQVLWHQGEGDKKGKLYLVIAVPAGDLRKQTEGLGPYAAAALKEVAKAPLTDPNVVFVLKPPAEAPGPPLVKVAGFSVKDLQRIAAAPPEQRATKFLFPAWTVTVEAIPKEAKPLP